jgi:hypothetical protein
MGLGAAQGDPCRAYAGAVRWLSSCALDSTDSSELTLANLFIWRHAYELRLAVQDMWCDEKHCDLSASLRAEARAVKQVLRNLERLSAGGAEPQAPEFDMTQVEEVHRAFVDVFAHGINEEKGEFARLFVKKIELDPDTGDVWTYLFSRWAFLAQAKKPASEETGFRIGLVAGAGFAADEKTRPTRLEQEMPFSLPVKPDFRHSGRSLRQHLAALPSASTPQGAGV